MTTLVEVLPPKAVPLAPGVRYMRLTEIVGQREVTEEEAARNRRAAFETARELKQLEGLKAAIRAAAKDQERQDRLQAEFDPKLGRYRELRRIAARPRRARKAVPGLLPISESSWWSGVRSGRYPQPVRLGARTTVWMATEVYALLERGNAQQAAG